MGESEQSKEAKNVQRRSLGQFNELRGINPSVENRFENYQTPFGYGAMNRRLEDLYKNRLGEMNKGINADVSRGISGSTASLASRGITGGSALDTAQERVRTGGRTAKATGAAQLGSTNILANLDAMREQNRNKFAETSSAQNVDFGNMRNLFQKFMTQQGNLGLQQGNLGYYDPTTAWDDFLNLGDMASGFIPGGGG